MKLCRYDSPRYQIVIKQLITRKIEINIELNKNIWLKKI